MERNEKHQSGLSREKWLALAIEALSIKSKSKFSLDSLIKSMPVTKGSQDQLMFLGFSDEDYVRQLKLRHDFFVRP